MRRLSATLLAVTVCALFAAAAHARSGASAHEVFTVLDLDESGTLTSGELPASLIAAGDVDSNGAISFNEFAAVLPQALSYGKAACKGGGWTVFGVFSNQGDCVSFFASA